MNDRIQELEKQCWSHRVDGTLVDGQLHFDTKKFAELIVRECIDIVSPYAIRMENFDGGHPVTDLKKHFGVEE